MHDLRYLIPILGLMIPILAIISRSVGRLIRLKEKQMEMIGTQSAEKAAQYAAQTERLEQRVRVLERIVTDKGIVVADEIDRLRDDRIN
jgi:ABC-type phosphate transport system auxiliary subunit